MAQVSKQEWRTFRANTARAFAAMHGRLNEQQRMIETQSLVITELLGVTAADAQRYRSRIDAVHAQVAAAAAMGVCLATLGGSLLADPEGGLPAETREALQSSDRGPLRYEELDLYDLIGPDPEAPPRSRWARWFGRRRAA